MRLHTSRAAAPIQNQVDWLWMYNNQKISPVRFDDWWALPVISLHPREVDKYSDKKKKKMTSNYITTAAIAKKAALALYI